MLFTKTVTPEEYVTQGVNYDELVNNVEASLCESIGDDNKEDGSYTSYLGDIVSGSYGWRQTEYVLRYFGYEFDEELDISDYLEAIVSEVDEVTANVADIMNKELKNRGLEGKVFFNNLEYDGAFGLFYTVDENTDEVQLILSENVEQK